MTEPIHDISVEGFIESFDRRYPTFILKTLLRDRTTGRNIIWADNEYEALGDGYMGDDEITVEKITGMNSGVIKPRIAKEQERQSQRTKSRAEVFTPSWLCNQMNNDLDEVWFGRRDVFNTEIVADGGANTWTPTSDPIEFPKSKGHGWRAYVEAPRLEITCGEAPFVCSRYDTVTGDELSVGERVGFLDRKLRVVTEKTKTRKEWVRRALDALRATYGFEYQGDNLLIARINVFETFAEHLRDRWGSDPQQDELEQAAWIVSWNFWQMNGRTYAVPTNKMGAEVESTLGTFEEPEPKPIQPSLFDLFEGVFSDEINKEIEEEEPKETVPLCVIYDWRNGEPFEFASLKGKASDMGKKFYAVIGNPPYQEENSQAKPKSNGQKPMTNIFQYFQEVTDQVTSDCAVLIYPGGRWIHQSGKGMKTFGHKQINDCHLSVVKLFPDASELFGDAAQLADGITIVVKDYRKKEPGFKYIYSKAGNETAVQALNPGDKLMPLDPNDLPLVQKIDESVRELGIGFLHDAILPRSLFPIESNFVENNPNLVRKYENDAAVDYSHEIKLFTNDKAGKTGRAMWFVAERSIITKNQHLIDEWQVVVSSANAGGQKRDNQLEIIDNHSAFGRSRVALRSFKTNDEAINFYRYVKTYIIRYAFLLTDEALTSLGKEVPDLGDYSNENSLINFDKDIDQQLCELLGIEDHEFSYIKNRVDSIRNGSSSESGVN
ncbi:Eco57I restriction-modification methylase domain-containing protein [Bifidobacterium choerinum]|uniref:Eco57I restriction endonuclease n=1 Tax=Bifidobacterium choerinum TaxID=35760 RepID=A0A087AF33_9BIFI|nr:Eco57I restriction-modification methylase domain-containing protein [Bifidobacterium choerinum]KFI57383.1 Eco57I restriction endonuclease [Bifidobacterium choerinum]